MDKNVRAWAILGLVSFALGLFLLAVVLYYDLQLDSPTALYYYLPGAIFVLIGLLVLWFQNLTYWPELLGISVLIFAGFVIFLANTAEEERNLKLEQLVVAADKFAGGAEGLALERPVDIVVYVPNASSTPVKQKDTVGKVVDIGEKAVVLEVDAGDAAEFQEALSFEKASIGVRYLDELPTTTPIPTVVVSPSLTPTPTETPTPVEGMVYLEIAASEIKPRSSELLLEENGQLVIIEKALQADGTPVPTGAGVVRRCVKVKNFVDKNGVRQLKYQAEKSDDSEATAAVLVEIREDDVEAIGRALTRSERTYLLLDRDCDPSVIPE